MTFDGPDGPDVLTMLVYGSSSIRHNDLGLLRDSNFDNTMAKVGNDAGRPLHMHRLVYGDAVFPWRPHLRSRHGASAAHPNKAHFYYPLATGKGVEWSAYREG